MKKIIVLLAIAFVFPSIAIAQETPPCETKACWEHRAQLARTTIAMHQCEIYKRQVVSQDWDKIRIEAEAALAELEAAEKAVETPED